MERFDFSSVFALLGTTFFAEFSNFSRPPTKILPKSLSCRLKLSLTTSYLPQPVCWILSCLQLCLHHISSKEITDLGEKLVINKYDQCLPATYRPAQQTLWLQVTDINIAGDRIEQEMFQKTSLYVEDCMVTTQIGILQDINKLQAALTSSFFAGASGN